MTESNLPQSQKSIKICSVSGCGENVKGRGLCNSHYMNWWRRGDPLAEGKYPKSDTLESRFWERVTSADPSDCWEWKGTRTIYGYGQFAFHGKLYRAHRVSFFIHNGYWPAEVVMHDCDNKICVNPHHLQAGTYLENTKQAHERGRYAVGERQGNAKLTNEQVIEIRKLFASNLNDRQIAEMFSVGRKCINAIRLGTSWKWQREGADDTHPHRP